MGAERAAPGASEAPKSGSAGLAHARVLVYGMNFAPEFAGVGKYTGEIAELLAGAGAEVTVVTTPPHYPGWEVKPPGRNTYSYRRGAAMRVFRCPLVLRRRMGGLWRLLAPLSFALTSAPVAAWQILARRPRVVFCVEPTLFVAPLALLAATLVGARTAIHVQDLEVDAAFAVGHVRAPRWLRHIALALEGLLLRRFTAVITISDAMATRLSAKGVDPARLSVIRNWTDFKHLHPLQRESDYRAELGYGTDDVIILYSGNIGAKQGLDILLDAARLLEATPQLHFVIVGEGPAKEELVARYAGLANVRFMPFQPLERLNELLNLADIHALPQAGGAADLVLPSKLGGMLATGKTVVVTADPDTELASFLSGQAVIVPAGEATALARAIIEIRAMPVEDRPKANAATLAMLSADTARRALLGVLGDLASSDRPAGGAKPLAASAVRADP